MQGDFVSAWEGVLARVEQLQWLLVLVTVLTAALVVIYSCEVLCSYCRERRTEGRRVRFARRAADIRQQRQRRSEPAAYSDVLYVAPTEEEYADRVSTTV
jgi:hypothetical protein